MAKFADYCITGIWKSGGAIGYVLLHKVNDDNTFEHGEDKSEAEAISILKTGKSIMTITWGYPDWKLGAKVNYETILGKECLRTDSNATTKDNLDNSILLTPIRK